MSILLTDTYEANKNNKYASLNKNNNEESQMAEGKDTSNLYIGGIILIAIIGVFILKGRETEHLESGASTESTQAAFDVANEKRKATRNVLE